MSEYFEIYACLWALALLHSLRPDDRSDLIFVLQGIVLAGFACLRFETGYDWPVYSAHYKGNVAELGLMFEPGYELLVAAFVHSGVEFKYYLSIISAFMIAAMMVILRNVAPRYKEIALAIMFAMPDFFLIPVFSVIRQTLSLLILMLGLVCLREGRQKAGRTLVILSFFFHYSTFFILGIVLLFRKLKFRDGSYLRLFGVFSVFYLVSVDVFKYVLNLLIQVLVPNYSYYLDRDTFNASIVYRFATLIISAFVLWLVFRGRTTADKAVVEDNSFGKHAALLSLMLPIILFNFPTFTSRFLFLGAFSIVGYVLAGISEGLRLSRVLICIVLGFALALPLYRFLSSPFSSPYVPYQSMLSYDETNSSGGERTQELLDMLDSLW